MPLKPMARLLMMILLALVTVACGTRQQRPDSKPQPQMPFPEPAANATELDPDMLFHYLVGEIAAQRGQLPLAYNHYMHAALLTGDAYAAERATRIGVFLKDDAKAGKAARRWVELAPNSLHARQAAGVLAFRAGDEQAADAAFDALVKIAEARGNDGYLQVGLSLLKEQDSARAQRYMRHFVQRHAGDARAHYAAAVVFLSSQDYAAASQALDRSLKLDAGWAKPKLLRAKILVDQGKAEQAIKALEKALQQHPDDREMRLTYARLLSGSDRKQAYRQFERLYRADSGDTDAIYALGVLALRDQRLAQARRWWQRLRDVGSDEQREEAAFRLGQVEEADGNDAAARDWYQQVSHGSFRIEASLRQAGLRAKGGDLAGAREILKQLRVLQPSRAVEFYLFESEMLRRYGKAEQVQALFADALKRYPDDIDLLYARGLYSAERYQLEQAEHDLRRILTLDPDHADAMNALGYTLADQTQRYNEALTLIQRAFKLKPDNPAILDSMGWVQYRLGQHQAALKFLRKALSLMDDDEIAAHLGEVLWVTGQQAEARKVWRGALDRHPGSDILRKVMQRYR